MATYLCLRTGWQRKESLDTKYWPLIGRYRSHDLHTGLWFVETDHVTCIQRIRSASMVTTMDLVWGRPMEWPECPSVMFRTTGEIRKLDSQTESDANKESHTVLQSFKRSEFLVCWKFNTWFLYKESLESFFRIIRWLDDSISDDDFQKMQEYGVQLLR